MHWPRVTTDRSGTAAVEFAIVAPIFLMMLMSLIGYGIFLSASHAIQQIAADAARTAVAGLTLDERVMLVRSFIDRATLDYAFIDRRDLVVNLAGDAADPSQFTVTLSYDAGDLPIWNMYAFAMPERTITRFSTIRLGGL
ncbi:TadE family protein [Ensifer soli]|uniref:TadE family protein n=1 Tax=Ciceribacter sp. sgz301302 TaxID=3342379 RepID=UPI0035B889E3